MSKATEIKKQAKGFITCLVLVLMVTSCCNNPDCTYKALEPPIVLTGKTFYSITCVDKNGQLWVSSTGWDVAQQMITEGFRVGDTVVFGPDIVNQRRDEYNPVR